MDHPPVNVVALRDGTGLPLALARLHWAMQPGQAVELTVGREGGRELSSLADIVHGAGFSVDGVAAEGDAERMRATRLLSLPDVVGPNMRLLVCGLNPSVYSAERGVGFARPGNRFWPAAVAAGAVSAPLLPLDALVHHGVGMTDLVKRATRRSSELAAGEYEAGFERVERLVTWLRPRAVCFVGLEGWRAAVDRKATAGLQAREIGGRPVYVMPSTSGLNAHSSPGDLAEHLRRALAVSGA